MKLFHFALIATLLAPCLGYSQTKTQSSSPPADQTVEGPTAFVQLQANSTPLGLVTSLDTNVGYAFSARFGADVGVPIFYVRSPFSLVINHDWKTDTLLGEPYLDAHYTIPWHGAQVTSVLTGTFPASSSVRIYTTGRVGVDWFNHIEPVKSFNGITPFFNFGVSNGTVNRYYMPRPFSIVRPYQTLCLMGDGEIGASYRIIRGFKLGASAYGLLPGGPQKVFSRLVTPGSSVVGDSNHGRFWYSAFETVGHSGIDRDNGFSAWLEVTRIRNVTVQIGATHSVHFAFDSLNLVVNFDATSLLRALTEQSE